MKCVEERLAEHRRKESAACDNSKISNDTIYEEKFRSNNGIAVHSATVSKFINILLKPIQLWSYFCCHWPRSCTAFAILLWIIVQWYFTYIEFGLVFFIFSLFFFLFINLGRRKSNELSAYSVFNPHCERLPGTLTAEHFERDLLKRKILGYRDILEFERSIDSCPPVNNDWKLLISSEM
ncbi:unnamed protein product [Onchocerca flexuosa]|uniref:SAYSvFN domain-containing protein n=1 Tax=Onchocerca flexuosa TaxID=387005 RepID=A0A183I0U3_9BILA|nr:unnamed protein product [Onchocerca flexuosa]